jgi:hypothetical protein
MGLFKRISEKEFCVVEENMWNIFTRMPWCVRDLRQGWQLKKWSRFDVPLAELIWMARDEVWEERYLQYAWLFKDGGAEIMDGFSRILVKDVDGFIYNDTRCRHVIVPSRQCGGFGCKALMLKSPDDVLNRLWRLYDAWLKQLKNQKQ